jgi:hypothetical protein
MVTLAFALLAYQREVKPIAVVRHKPIAEMSGLARSNNFPGVYWTLNDSGDTARIFPIKLDGNVVIPESAKKMDAKTPWPGISIQNAKNVDWEDISLEGNTLYIADTGNNNNNRKNLGVYSVREPNPYQATSAKATFYPVVYPDQKEFPPSIFRFDCEAMFALSGKLYFVTKHRLGKSPIPDGSCSMYVMETRYTDKPNVLRKIGTKTGMYGWITGAAVSPSGKKFVLLSDLYRAGIWVFDIEKGKEPNLSAKSKFIPLSGVRQCEAITFENEDTVIVCNEQRDLFRISLK